MKQSMRGNVLAVVVGCLVMLPSLAAADNLSRFGFSGNAAISGYNNEHLTGVTPLQCADACLGRTWCKSFDYYRNDAACDLSDRSAEDVGGLKTDYAGNPFDHYSVLPSGFSRTPNAAIYGYNNEHLTGVTPSQCASACLGRTWCKSFDYYKYERQCDLSDKSAADVGGLKTDYAGHPYDHHARAPAGPQTLFALKNVGRNEYFNINDEGSYWPADFRLQSAKDESWTVGDTSFGPNVKTFTTSITPGYCSNGSPSNGCPDQYRLCAYSSSGFRARVSLSDGYVGTPSNWNGPECAWIVEDLGNGRFKMRNQWLQTTYGAYIGYLRCSYYYDCTFDYGSGSDTTAHWQLE
ncbi:PAN domain-containing protein [Pyxidicoccus sp. MSG2]|uniref:PAN domain-containing protein n=1 Tax=Pyxidicoccus sp. MSG2 TaxID=2996790 RepID=UPI00226DD976|nr:PAN domain-containing protein [Pyxidicoccus sp. MSG2]MCY1021614.1 PAN domain-containing protein [Pyxidicoccus sp. MSG2]